MDIVENLEGDFSIEVFEVGGVWFLICLDLGW